MAGTAELADDAALVLFSGGQDSTTCLAWALGRYARVETVGFAYGQRHAVEMACREPLRAALGALDDGWRARLGPDRVIDAGVIGAISDTALTRERAIEIGASSLPTTFVPGRNLIFLALAAALAYRRGIRHIVGGMGEADYSGYPDCRDGTIRAMQTALNLGMEAAFELHTPLMWRDKRAVWALAQELGGDALVDIVIELTHSCYLGDRDTRHPWGYGCGACPACDLRAAGYRKFIEDTAEDTRV